MGKKVLFAVGGTGGHLFPAQALAEEIKKKEGTVEILFAGGSLGSNRFFHHLKFPFKEVSCSSPAKDSKWKFVLKTLRGIVQSLKICREFQPDWIVGFGSFYSFPLLVAARIKKIPYILVESNAYPGKVNRLFSKKAALTAIQFEEAKQHLKGVAKVVKMPHFSKELEEAYLPPAEARKYFGLEPDRFTFLVFGGSQGAERINWAASELWLDQPFQVLHFCGQSGDVKHLRSRYAERGIQACVKPFEQKMHLAWKAADLSISRSGGGTLTEMIEFQVPGVLIPWPGAAEGHQLKNANVMQKRGSALTLEEGKIDELSAAVKKGKAQIEKMRNGLKEQLEGQKQTLCASIFEQMERKT
jgi:UDP-N-acetylglucosamine--N-acetylmuramyl-(pentapeptide) pyrophosphoryl-undecaprenol N-acetylglucosamine transferase